MMFHIERRYIFLLAISALLFVGSMLIPSLAEAQCVEPGHHWVQMATGVPVSGGSWMMFYGIQGENRIFNPQVCFSFWVNAQGILLDSGNWVELGWSEDVSGYQEFFSMCVINEVPCLELSEGPVTFQPNTFKLDHALGSDYWRFTVNGVIVRRKHTMFLRGVALAGQERHSRSNIDPDGTVWREMQRADNNNNWRFWQNIGCWKDTDFDYKWVVVTTDKFKVVLGDGTTNCQSPF